MSVLFSLHGVEQIQPALKKKKSGLFYRKITFSYFGKFSQFSNHNWLAFQEASYWLEVNSAFTLGSWPMDLQSTQPLMTADGHGALSSYSGFFWG
jgi:hypothetical protein